MKRKIYMISIVILVIAASGYFFITRTNSGKNAIPEYFFLITLDTTRADYVDYSTGNNNLTPRLAELAKAGIIFPNAYSLIPITLPSHTSMFYALPPHLLKIYNNQQVNTTSYPSVAQMFKENGYQTGAVISLGVLGSIFGMSKGFDTYRENFKPSIWYRRADEVNRDAMEMIKEAGDKKSFFWIHYSDPHAPYGPPDYKGDFSISFNQEKIFSCNSIDQPLVEFEIEAKPGKNTLSMATTVPYSPLRKAKAVMMGINFLNFTLSADCAKGELDVIYSKEWKNITPRGKFHYFSRKRNTKTVFVNHGRQPIKIQIKFNYKIMLNRKSVFMLYKNEIQYMDQKFGELIDFLKSNNLYDKSTFVVMGDHGEGLGEYRGCVGHIHYLNKLFLHVPLFIAGKGIKMKGKTDSRLVSNLNIAPTLLDIARIKKSEFMQGCSLLGQGHPARLLLETYAPEAFTDGFSLIRYPYQIIYYPRREDDKFEFINLEDDKLGIKNLIKQNKDRKIKIELVNSVIKISKELLKMKKIPGAMTPEQIDILKSLGYL
jgi:hypothetical protein